jgi:hypothetical protein
MICLFVNICIKYRSTYVGFYLEMIKSTLIYVINTNISLHVYVYTQFQHTTVFVPKMFSAFRENIVNIFP